MGGDGHRRTAHYIVSWCNGQSTPLPLSSPHGVAMRLVLSRRSLDAGAVPPCDLFGCTFTLWLPAAARRAPRRPPLHVRRLSTTSGNGIVATCFFSDLRPWLFPGRDRRSIALDHARKRLRPSPRWSAARRQPRRRLLEPSDRLGARLERAGRHRFLPKRDLQVSETSMIGASRPFIFKTIAQWSIPEHDRRSARFETQYFRPDERPSPGSTRNTSSRMSVPQPSSKRGAVALATEQRFGTTPVKFLFCPVGVRT